MTSNPSSHLGREVRHIGVVIGTLCDVWRLVVELRLGARGRGCDVERVEPFLLVRVAHARQADEPRDGTRVFHQDLVVAGEGEGGRMFEG